MGYWALKKVLLYPSAQSQAALSFADRGGAVVLAPLDERIWQLFNHSGTVDLVQEDQSMVQVFLNDIHLSCRSSTTNSYITSYEDVTRMCGLLLPVAESPILG